MSIIKIYNRQCPCQINTTIERKQDNNIERKQDS